MSATSPSVGAAGVVGWGFPGHRLATEIALDLLPTPLRQVLDPIRREILEQCVKPDQLVASDPREQPKRRSTS
jgi:hypothetical protein